MKNNPIKYTYLVAFLFLVGLISCDDILDVELPSNVLSSSTVYVSDATAEAAVNGIYQSMVTDTYYNFLHTNVGQAADELLPNSLIPNVFVTNEIPETDGIVGSMWSQFYKTIYNANNVIEGVGASTTLSPTKSKQWIAEAKFTRAFCYFYLTNLWGDVPLVLTTNIDKSALAPKTAQSEVYTQILLDLEQASADLPVDYKNYRSLKVRATKWAAEALLARVNLYMGRWSDASEHASVVLDQAGMFGMITDLSSDNSPFIADNDEAILQLPYRNFLFSYEGGSVFTDAGGYLLRNSNSLFEPGDARQTNWTISIVAEDGKTYFAPLKYKNSFVSTPVERSTVLRLAELYLIRAEARARLNNSAGAQSDINVIRDRALLPATTLTDPAQLLALIAKERQRELFAEFGHRWFDLKRTETMNQVLGATQGKLWATTDSLFPIPEEAIRSNPFLTQNSGY
jgi:hypothetical protein